MCLSFCVAMKWNLELVSKTSTFIGRTLTWRYCKRVFIETVVLQMFHNWQCKQPCSILDLFKKNVDCVS